jgi:hypothetical protein
MDITDFVKEQKQYVDNKELHKLVVPIERIIDLEDKMLEAKIGIKHKKSYIFTPKI